MRQSALHKLMALIGLISLGLWPAILAAQTTSLETKVTTEASTGNQSAGEEETITTGSASASVNVHTTINGQDIEPIIVERKSSAGDQQVEVRQEIEAQTGQPPKVETQVTVDGQRPTVAASPSLDSPVPIQPVPDNPQEPSAPNFFQHIWDSITHFFTKLFSLFD